MNLKQIHENTKKQKKKPKLKFKSNTQIYNLRYSKIKKKKINFRLKHITEATF